jgi:hypothetical protein
MLTSEQQLHWVWHVQTAHYARILHASMLPNFTSHSPGNEGLQCSGGSREAERMCAHEWTAQIPVECPAAMTPRQGRTRVVLPPPLGPMIANSLRSAPPEAPVAQAAGQARCLGACNGAFYTQVRQKLCDLPTVFACAPPAACSCPPTACPWACLTNRSA